MSLLLSILLAFSVGARAEGADQPLDLGEASALLHQAGKPTRHVMPVSRQPRDVVEVMTAAAAKVARLEAQLGAIPQPASSRALGIVAEVRAQVAKVAAKNRADREKTLKLLENGDKIGYDVKELKDREEYVFRARMDLTYGYFLIQPLNESLTEWGKAYVTDLPLKPEMTLQDFCANDLAPSQELDSILFQLDPSIPRSPAPGICDGKAPHS
jgi:hypothetical protein